MNRVDYKTVRKWNITFVVFVAALNAAAAAPHKILSECDGYSTVRAEVAEDAKLKVNFSIAGAPTCYSVTVIVGGSEVKGYILDSSLDAVQAFEKSRAEAEREAFKAAPVHSPPPPAAKSASTEGSSAADEPKRVLERVAPSPKKALSGSPEAPSKPVYPHLEARSGNANHKPMSF